MASNRTSMHSIETVHLAYVKGILCRDEIRRATRRGQGVGTILRATNHYGGAESLRGTQKISNNFTSTFFYTVHLLPKNHSFEHGSVKLAL